MEYLNTSRTHQQGVVLIVALIMVIAVTGIAVTLMSSSSIDIKITNAAQEREIADNTLMGEVQKTMATESLKGGNSRFFLTPVEVPLGGVDLALGGETKSLLINLNTGAHDLQCPRKFSYTAGISCNMMQMNTTIEYGSKSKHTLAVVTGVAQEMVSLNTGS